jgi:hypothetical protein
MLDLVAMVRGNALQAADRHRLAVDAGAAARRLTRSIAGTAKDAGKNVRFAIQEIGVGESPMGNQSNVFRNVGMRRTSPLAIDDTVVVRRISDIRWIHAVT